MKIDPISLQHAFGRRRLLRALAGLLGGAALGPLAAAGVPGTHEAALRRWLRGEGAGILGDLPAVARLGSLYLDGQAQERDGKVLARLLIGGDAAALRAPVRARLIEAIARDWRNHDVTVLDGWVYARTEARICAAVHLLGMARA